jgi:hypothetical protein
MSVKIMTAVWELKLSHAEKLVLLAFADNANDENRAWPSVARVAWKSGYSERQVQRIIHDMIDRGLLKIEAPATPTDPTKYSIHPEHGVPLPPFHARNHRGDKTAPGDTMTPGDNGRRRGDIAMSPEPSREPSRERSPSPPRASTSLPADFTVTKAMRDQLTLAGVRLTSAEVARGTAKFIANAQAKDERRADWPAAWLRWMLDEPGFTAPRSRRGGRGAEPLIDPEQYKGDNYLKVRGG